MFYYLRKNPTKDSLVSVYNAISGDHILQRIKKNIKYLARAMSDVSDCWAARRSRRNRLRHVFGEHGVLRQGSRDGASPLIQIGLCICTQGGTLPAAWMHFQSLY